MEAERRPEGVIEEGREGRGRGVGRRQKQNRDRHGVDAKAGLKPLMVP